MLGSLFHRAVIVLLTLAPPSAAAQTLESVREEVRHDQPSAPRPSSNASHSESWDENDSGWDVLLFGAGVTAPFWAPAMMMGDDYRVRRHFNDYPYYADGGLMLDDATNVERSYLSSWQFRAEYGADWDNQQTIGGHLLVTTNSIYGRWGIDTEWNHRQEELTVDADDALWTGDFNIVYRFAQSSWGQMHSGVGFNWLADDLGSDFGFNFTYGGDFFPRDPLVLSASLDWGTLGHATLFHTRATAGIMLWRSELYAGVDYYSVGRADITTLITGVRVWW